MIRNPCHRFTTVLFVLASLLFTQLALAGYTCPGIGNRAAEVAAMARTAMPCAESMGMTMDESQPNLCHAHCLSDQQTADTWQVPVLASLPQSGADYLVPRILPEPTGEVVQAPLLRRTTAPPLSIRNCCFRI